MLVRTGILAIGSSSGGIVPTIETFTLAFPTKAPSCSPIAMTGTWVLTNPDNASYKLRIQQTGTEFNCETSFGTVVYTQETYLDGLSGTVTPTLTLQVIRRSDSTVMSSANATCNESIAVGDSC
jgi:hypothetical protein